MGRFPLWTWVVAGVAFTLSVVAFLRYKDLMILIFGMIAGGLAFSASSLMDGSRYAAVEVVRIKCRECGALNAEDAKFCSQCGRPI